MKERARSGMPTEEHFHFQNLLRMILQSCIGCCNTSISHAKANNLLGCSMRILIRLVRMKRTRFPENHNRFRLYIRSRYCSQVARVKDDIVLRSDERSEGGELARRWRCRRDLGRMLENVVKVVVSDIMFVRAEST